jgi:Protein of unknown function (DUF4058)
MPSPFPGMNPFLEQNDSWEDFHTNYIGRCQEALTGQVGESYVVKIEVRLLLHELPAEERTRFIGEADVGITGPPAKRGQTATATLPAPQQIPFPAVVKEKHRYLEIRDRRDRRLVTVIELLSPSNKTPGPDRDDYLSKRTRYSSARINLVEIDLRRGGTRPGPPQIPPCDYYVGITRHWSVLDFWPIGLRERLPPIPIPLSPPDADVPLDLQEVFHRTYDAADYGKYIYGETPDPPLRPEDEAWAREIVTRELAARTASQPG